MWHFRFAEWLVLLLLLLQLLLLLLLVFLLYHHCYYYRCSWLWWFPAFSFGVALRNQELTIKITINCGRSIFRLGRSCLRLLLVVYCWREKWRRNRRSRLSSNHNHPPIKMVATVLAHMTSSRNRWKQRMGRGKRRMRWATWRLKWKWSAMQFQSLFMSLNILSSVCERILCLLWLQINVGFLMFTICRPTCVIWLRKYLLLDVDSYMIQPVSTYTRCPFLTHYSFTLFSISQRSSVSWCPVLRIRVAL